jgi:predicted polyphosphate/ATP-dependent NAD kinase
MRTGDCVRIGLIVNPFAGLGGPLGLKGSDAAAIRHTLDPTCVVYTAGRALAMLRRLDLPALILLTAGGTMGADAASAAGFSPHVVYRPRSEPTCAADTVAAANAICAEGADLLVFAGGDGTARDLLDARVGATPVLGVPAGVKMHSAVFATSPAAAAAAIEGLASPPFATAPAEVIDRAGPDQAPRLFGVLTGLATPRRQAAKASPPGTKDADLRAAATYLAGELREAPLAIVGPGATMALVKAAMPGTGTLLGVDAYADGTQVARDADAATLLALADDRPVRIALGVVGGQGFLLGRGNQQLSPALVRRATRDGLTVLAAVDKLAALPGGRLLVDSGDPELDTLLAGHLAVRTGVRRTMLMLVEPA